MMLVHSVSWCSDVLECCFMLIKVDVCCMTCTVHISDRVKNGKRRKNYVKKTKMHEIDAFVWVMCIEQTCCCYWRSHSIKMLNKALLSIPFKSIQSMQKKTPDSFAKNNFIGKKKCFLHVLFGRYGFLCTDFVFAIKVQFSDKKCQHKKVFRLLWFCCVQHKMKSESNIKPYVQEQVYTIKTNGKRNQFVCCRR